ncbi:MAG: DUF4416 family protein [candidate division KSB1 bacterium]|nr:DUF4416 family protein [candidate division KSB1 bacterium]
MQPQSVTPVKLICGVLYSDASLCEQARSRLESLYGRVDYKSKEVDFNVTDYYDPEMGTPIVRLFYSFRQLISPGDLARIKIDCNRIEDDLAQDGQRKVNLDPGYLDYDKFVLASAKYNGHKVYLDQGIYADVTLFYQKGRFDPSPYCFPDFKDGRYDETFLHIRAQYKGQLRKLMRNGREKSD